MNTPDGSGRIRRSEYKISGHSGFFIKFSPHHSLKFIEFLLLKITFKTRKGYNIVAKKYLSSIISQNSSTKVLFYSNPLKGYYDLLDISKKKQTHES